MKSVQIFSNTHRHILRIKLRPVGEKKQISFRVVVAEVRSKLKGKFVDDLSECGSSKVLSSRLEEKN